MNSYLSSKRIKSRISSLESTYRLKIGSNKTSYVVITNFYSLSFAESTHQEVGIELKCSDLVKILSDFNGSVSRKTDVLYF